MMMMMMMMIIIIIIIIMVRMIITNLFYKAVPLFSAYGPDANAHKSLIPVSLTGPRERPLHSICAFLHSAAADVAPLPVAAGIAPLPLLPRPLPSSA